MTTPADLSMTHPIYTLNLTGAQRSILEWLTQNGALFTLLRCQAERVLCRASRPSV